MPIHPEPENTYYSPTHSYSESKPEPLVFPTAECEYRSSPGKSSRFVPNLTTLPQDNMILPAALNQLGFMCRPTAGNYVNKKYFNIHYDSGMRSMNSTKTNANLKGTTQNVMFMKYTYSPKGGKLINQRYTSPAIQHEDPAVPLAGGPDRVSIAQPRWLLFSSDDPASDTAQFNINISSVRRYRDHVGAEL